MARTTRRTRSAGLPALRREIDRIDQELLRLLNARAALALQVGALKRAKGQPVHDGAREADLLHRLARANRGPLTEASVLSVFHEIVRQSRQLESSAGVEEGGA